MNLLEWEEENDGVTTPNPWKRVAAIGSYHPRKMEMKMKIQTERMGIYL